MRNMLVIAAFVGGILAMPATAAEISVQMLNKGEKGGMVFQPDFVKAMPGDTIKFVSVDKGHNVEAIKGMIPEGVEPFKSKINDDFVLTVEKEGLYGVKCTPHYGMGMVAMIAVGNPANEVEAKAVKQTGKAKQRFEEIFAAFEAAK
jgi:pseudoazurin